MPWTFYDKNGNQKQAAANAVRPIARVTQGSAQSVSNGVQTLLTFSGVGAADFDTYASVSPMWASGNPGRLTAPITGRYRVHASVAYVNTGANFTAGIELRKNGATALSGTTNGWTSESDGNSNAMDATVELALSAGDYIEILSYQQGGAARNTIPAGTFLTMEYLDGAVTVGVPTLFSNAGYGTALPASPSDGNEFILVDSTSAPTYSWRLRYNATAAKWDFIGGSWLEGTTTVTVPRAGSYYVEIGAQGGGFGASSPPQLTITAGGITLTAGAGGNGGGTEGVFGSIMDRGKMTGLTASQVLTPTPANSPTRAYIRIQPVQIV